MKQFFSLKNKKTRAYITSACWFLVGAGLGLFFLASFSYILFQNIYKDKIYPGVRVNGINYGGQTRQDLQKYFLAKNEKISQTSFTFYKDDIIATISAKQLNFGYDDLLLAEQGYSIGRGDNKLSNLSLILQSYITGINLPPAYHYSEEELTKFLDPIKKQLTIEPVDALFSFQNGKVTAFRPSSDGQEIDTELLKLQIASKTLAVVTQNKPQDIPLSIPIKIVKPSITTDEANEFGIEELIGTGTSLFQHSIPGRIFNVTLAASRVNGVLVKPGEVFSFNKALGDVSSFTGYQQAYIIQGGKTVLGDGGGVCQVSSTFFRAILNAGLPVIERSAHAYRVGYYEQDSPPGFDATVYVPTVDLKFKNDTDNYILIQSVIDPIELRLTYYLYGKKDGREVSISQPSVTNQKPAPEPSFQDDPTLPKGQVKQIDFAAGGATVSFARQVTKNGEVVIQDTYRSVYRPWQAMYLRGTKE